MPTIQSAAAAAHGLHTNRNNGVYQQGKHCGIEKKLLVAQCYNLKVQQSGGKMPTITSIAQECSVGWDFAKKVVEEVDNNNGFVIHPDQIQQEKATARGVGAQSLDTVDEFVLYYLYLEKPFRSNKSYVQELHHITGNLVSQSTVSRFFTKGSPIKGNLRKPNLIPYDKFKPENIQRAFEYLEMIKYINPARIKFADEKLLKGDEVYNRKNRRNVLTGEVPPVVTPSDFRNTYSITGFCSIDMSFPQAMWVHIHDEKNDATSFSMGVESAIASGYLKRGDVLVMDNAKIHIMGDNEGLEELLWREFGIMVLLLPTRSPELNPIELVWRTLVQRLKQFPLDVLKSYGSHSTAKAAFHILNNMTHHDDQFQVLIQTCSLKIVQQRTIQMPTHCSGEKLCS